MNVLDIAGKAAPLLLPLEQAGKLADAFGSIIGLLPLVSGGVPTASTIVGMIEAGNLSSTVQNLPKLCADLETAVKGNKAILANLQTMLVSAGLQP